MMVLGQFVFKLKSWDGLKLLFQSLSAPSNAEPLDFRGLAASIKEKKAHLTRKLSKFLIANVRMNFIMFLKFPFFSFLDFEKLHCKEEP